MTINYSKAIKCYIKIFDRKIVGKIKTKEMKIFEFYVKHCR